MAIIKCKMCGGDLVLVEGQSVAECEYCGSKQTVPAADNEKKLNLFASANKLRAACEFDRAAGVYDAIKAEFPSEAEAYWGLVLCKYGIEYVDDPATGKKVPTCHRLSFDSVMDDGNLEMAMDCADSVARKVYREEAKQLEKIRTGILEVSSNEKPYDIFICYKETDENGDRTLDSVLAQDLYSALTDKGYRVFFSRITLQSKLGEAYEPYIFAALNSAKVMLAIGTDPDYYSAVWVKNEWSRYLKICAGDSSKHLIPCYKDMDAYDLPREFRPLQGVDLGKMGAVQDILFNMEKYIPLKKQTTTVIQEKVVVGTTGGSNKIESLLDRGNMALEDGDWAKADSFFEDVLNNDSKNAQSYIGKTLAQEKCRTLDALVRKRKDVYQRVRATITMIPERTAHISDAAEKFALPGYLEADDIRFMYDADRTYESEVSDRKRQYQEERSWWENHKNLSRAEKFAAASVAEKLQQEKKRLFAQLNDRIKQAEQAEARTVAQMEKEYDAFLAETDAQVWKLHQTALARREMDYQTWLEQAKKETEPEVLRDLSKNFASLGSYKDSRDLAEHCTKRAAEEQEKQEAAIARREAEKKERIRKMILLASGITAAVLAAVLLMTRIVLPSGNYRKAEELLAAGDLRGAVIAFAEAGSWKDAQEHSLDLWGQVAQRETISARDNHTVALRSNGTVAAVGGTYGGCCDVGGMSGIVSVSSGAYHTVGLREDGTVALTEYTENYYYGQCDVETWTDIVAVSAKHLNTVGLRKDGTVVAVGWNQYGQCDVEDWTEIVAITSGNSHTVGLRCDGTVVATGFNEDGSCDVGSWTDIVAISAGGHTVGLRSDGTVVAVGDNDSGKRDVGGWTDIVAVSAGNAHTVGLRKDGTVVAVGANLHGQCDVGDWADIVAISAGDYYTVGLRSDGTVVAVGDNDHDQCKVGFWTNIRLPEISEEQQSAMAAAKQEREAKLAAERKAEEERLAAEKKAEEERLAKEYAAAEELADNGETVKAAMAFSELGGYQDAWTRCFELWGEITERETVSAGSWHTLGLKNDGTVVSTGQIPSTSDWVNIAAVSGGRLHAVGLKNDGTVVAVGSAGGKDNKGQCNVSAWSRIVAVSAGGYHTVGLRSNGTVVAVGEQAQCNVSGWSEIVAISAGYNHTVGLKKDGTVVAVGYNADGQCDVSEWCDIIAISAGYKYTLGLKKDGTVVAVGQNLKTNQLNVSGWRNISDISAAYGHTAGLRNNGTVAVAGSNQVGQCNVTGWQNIVAISIGNDHTVGLRSDGTVVAVGYQNDGRCDVSTWKNIRLP